jgi:hypothetical protein
VPASSPPPRLDVLRVTGEGPAYDLPYLARPGSGPAVLFVHAAVQIAGIRAVLLHAMSDDGKRFYARAGFHECPVDPTMMMRLAPASNPLTAAADITPRAVGDMLQHTRS